MVSAEKEQLVEGYNLKKISEIVPEKTPSYNILVDRRLFRQSQLNLESDYEKPEVRFADCAKAYFRCAPLHVLYNLIPVTKWLPRYKVKDALLYDILAGLTVAVMHIPQGMAYGLLGNVPPIIGIYMGFFPVLIYFFLGTSRHISIGTFAIVCLMTGKVVSNHASDEPGGQSNYTSIEVATTVTFVVGLYQIAMHIFKMGMLANFLSEMFVQGFTCACACHVVGSQLKDLFGLPVKKHRGHFALIKTIYDACLAVPQANQVAVGISLTVIVITVINNEIVKPRLAKKTKVPFPIELACVVVGTAVSYFMDFQKKYDITIVGHIPTGMPNMTPPSFKLIPEILMECLVVAIISYTIAISMALIFASKSNYDINANQELLAVGASNVVGSLFSCMPISASLSRSMMQHAVGGKTQLASIVSCLILLTVLLWIGPLFEHLPRAVLASIIVVALKGMLMQCTKLVLYWKTCKWDALIWVLTFLVTVIFRIDIGLLAGVGFSLIYLLCKAQQPYTCILGNVPSTDLYLDTSRYKGVVELDGIKIFHYCGSLSFATKAVFKNQLYKLIKFNKKQYMANSSVEDANLIRYKCVIIDCSALTYIDPAGVDQLRAIHHDFKEAKIELYLATCSGPVFEMFTTCDYYQKKGSKFQIFPRVHDAALYANYVIFKDDAK